MSQPLISILTPYKNTANFLEDCLESIIKQTYSNWELLIVDDHSTDDSERIVKRFAAVDSRIKPLINPETGIISALRKAFSASKGSYITRMDSDDIMHPEKINSMASDLLKHDKGHLALGLVEYFNEDGVNDGYKKYETWLNSLTIIASNFSEIYKECVIPSPCWMMHREDLIKCGAFTNNRYPEDYDLTFRFYSNGIKCIPSDKILHFWRDYPTRTSRTHIHYAQNYFLGIKLDYFLALDYDKYRALTVWGAGTKGKTIAKNLVKRDIPFTWICDNPKKIGNTIYGKELKNFKTLSDLFNPQSIVTVANQSAQEEIRAYFNNEAMLPMIDYFFFC